MDYNDAAGVFRRDGCAKQDVSSAWAIRGVADYNEDGMNDLLWRNKQTGANVIMFMDGINEVISHTLPAVSTTNGRNIFGVGPFHYNVDTE